MITFPNAKINLGLYIGRTLPDGYHEIVTAMVPVMWRDALEIVPADDVADELTVTGRPVDCPPHKNIVMKALGLMREALPGALPPVHIFLRKIIPDGAGMGGGSADGTFTLKMLNELAGNKLTDSRLHEVAARLGSDCPFFLANRPALATGTGTTLRPIELPSLRGKCALIAKPSRSVSTAEAYRNVRPSHTTAAELLATLRLPVEQWQGRLHNDFEATVGAMLPEVGMLIEWLMGLGAEYAAMTGSGSAVFGIFPSDKMSVLEDVARSPHPMAACARACGFILD